MRTKIRDSKENTTQLTINQYNKIKSYLKISPSFHKRKPTAYSLLLEYIYTGYIDDLIF